MTKEYTDVVALVLCKNGLYRYFHFGGKQIILNKDFAFDGVKYRLSMAGIYQLRSWLPWMDFRMSDPLSFAKYIWVINNRKVGLLIYHQPEGEAKPAYVEPINPLEREEAIEPAHFKALVLSPLRRTRFKKLKFGRMSSPRMLIYALIGVIVVIAILIFMGYL